MAIDINEISSETALLINNDIYAVIEFNHVKPGKGSAFVRVKLKNVKTNAVLERTFRSAERLDDVHLEEKELEFLYHAGDHYQFMDHSTYEELALSEGEIGEGAKFLLENLVVTALAHQGKILKVILPTFIVSKIVETEPGIRGDSSRAGNKPARIETGANILVPLFVNTGDVIKVDTRTGQYVERVQQ